MEFVYRTDTGKVRAHNEDHAGIFESNSSLILAVIADGMGGHLAGDVASKMAINLLQDKWEKETALLNTPEKAEEWFQKNIKKINEEIFQYANEHPECQGMGTTLVAVLCSDQFVTVAHIGDSRCYILDQDGFRQITDDHSLVNELVKSGQISKEEAEHHPRKNVLLRALGTEANVTIDTKTFEFERGDCIVLCSDGLTNKVSDLEIKKILSEGQPIENKANQLVELANHYGGEDNISVAIIYNVVNGKDGD
jgi:PPM family protein phosphatase